MIKTLRNFYSIFTFRSGILMILALFSTHICIQLGWTARLPTSLIGVAVVFPIVFSINAAYQRREVALDHLATMKASSAAMLYLIRDQPFDESQSLAVNLKNVMLTLFEELETYLEAPEERHVTVMNIHAQFNEISLVIKELKHRRLTGAEVAMASHYFQTMISDFERLRNIYLYRTPMALRAYTQVFLQAFPILFAPYFAEIATNHYEYAGYTVAALYSMVTICLDNIQEELENPFDGFGMDDINLNMSREYRLVLEKTLQMTGEQDNPLPSVEAVK